MQNVTARLSNPFDMDPGCEPAVLGYGDANAHFHVIGDRPAVHGGADSGFPFTDRQASERLQRALVDGGLLEAAGAPPTVDRTFLSYLYPCVTEGTPTEAEYDRLEPLFDAELRAVTAHVLLPVGERATRHVLEHYTATSADGVAVEASHATEVQSGGWLVYPIRDPADWTDRDERRLVTALRDLLASDYRREADLGRFLHGGDSYFVR
ncbi:MAG: uracil-DNA glycosylase family protein [Haloarculaceae archaeon]